MTDDILGGHIEAPDARRKPATARTLVFTSAQNNTKVHDGFFKSLLMYCEHRNAELHISRYTYQRTKWNTDGEKPGGIHVDADSGLWYDERIMPYVSDESLQITDDLVWCGELNILPTRVNPLSNLRTYTRQASAVVPHAKMRMVSIPTMKMHPTKFLYTTGTVTQRNYIQKVTGQVAEFHHVYGALVVEVDEDGSWWARQLNAGSDGSFYDLDRCYDVYSVDTCYPVASLVHGDIHVPKVNKDVLNSVFGAGGVVDKLKPENQFFHDLLDFKARNHHNRRDPHFMTEEHNSTITSEISMAHDVLWSAARKWSKLWLVTSNHDMAVLNWLKDSKSVPDNPANALLWYRMNAELLGDPFLNPYEALLRQSPSVKTRYTVVREDDSVQIAGIEHGIHGHLGPNGARGTPLNLRDVGKANTGHTHSAGIVDGIYTAGVLGSLDMGYNKGQSSWSHSSVVTYENGKRAIITAAGPDYKFWRDQ